jgi:hypothetical protein
MSFASKPRAAADGVIRTRGNRAVFPVVSRELMRLIHGSAACRSRSDAPRVRGTLYYGVDRGASFLFLIPVS